MRLRPETPNGIAASNLVSSDDFTAVRAVAPIDRLDSLLKDLKEGTIPVDGRTVMLGPPPDRPETVGIPPNSQPWTFYDLEPESPRCWLGSDPRSRTYQLETSGPAFQKFWTAQEWKELEDRLMNNNPPVNGMHDLAENLLGYWCAFEQWQGSAQVAVIAPLYSGLEEEIEASETSVLFRAFGPATATLEDYRLATVVTGSTSVERVAHPLQRSAVSTADHTLRMEGAVSAPEGLIVNALLLFRGVKVGQVQHVISTRNPRMLAHRAFDRDFELLYGTLSEAAARRDSEAFEVAVAWLFHLCGFQTVNYGLRPLKPDEEIDILAFAPYGRTVLAIEATLRSPLNKDKLSKLRRRVADLEKGLQGFEVQSVVVSASDTVFPAEVDDALALGIIPLYREQLTEVLDLAVKNASPRDIVGFIRGLWKDRGQQNWT